MDTENRFPQLIIKPNSSEPTLASSLPSISQAHFIPATSKQSVYDAKVSQYFTPTVKPSENYGNCLQATLLGHQIIGKAHKTDKMFDAFMLKDKDEVTLTLLRKVQEVIDWRKDRSWAENDGPYMNIEKCIEIQKALHDF